MAVFAKLMSQGLHLVSSVGSIILQECRAQKNERHERGEHFGNDYSDLII